jgi:sec-independent protein translocase protein TatB
MFDIGFSELLLFGIIALIVLGPEKLPKAARTAGQWYAKLRRTVSTLQSEIEAEFDLAETRQQMQDELAKIRQTEVDMKREMAEMRGNMREFESSQQQSLKASQQPVSTTQQPSHVQNEPTEAVPGKFDYSYGRDSTSTQSQHTEQQSSSAADGINKADQANNVAVAATGSIVQPIVTRPWENMWFRLGPYDKKRRLPAAPRLPNYKADSLLNANTGSHASTTFLAQAPADATISSTSLAQQEAE